MRRVVLFIVVLSSCSLPLVARTSGPKASTEPPLRVELSREVQIDADTALFRLTFVNDGDEDLIVHIPSITTGPAASRSKVIREKPEGDSVTAVTPARNVLEEMFRIATPLKEEPVRENFAAVLRHSRVELSLRALLGDASELELHFDDCVFALDGSLYSLPPIALASPSEPLEGARPSRLHIGVRVLGGVLIGPVQVAPLMPMALLPLTPTGFLEGFVGYWSRWFEGHLVLRPGLGRVVALEGGVRPGVEWLTVFLNYGFDAFQPQTGYRSSEPLVGHGPRLSAELTFDAPQQVLGITRPQRFGAFVTGGWSWLPSPVDRRPIPVPVVEAGLRMRLH